MSKPLMWGLVVCIVLGGAPMVLAAEPALQPPPAQISSPAENAVIRGTVPIIGTAVDPDFWKYEVHFAPDPNPQDQWTIIGSIHEQQVVDGLLETWNTTTVPDGIYTLRLRVVNRTSNYREFFVKGLMVANAEPTETPAPTATALPTPTITPAATPTFAIPTSPLAQPTATPTLARPTRSALPDMLDLNAWRQSVCLGAELMAIVAVAIAFIFILRRLL
jgi:hypothetical protein